MLTRNGGRRASSSRGDSQSQEGSQATALVRPRGRRRPQSSASLSVLLSQPPPALPIRLGSTLGVATPWIQPFSPMVVPPWPTTPHSPSRADLLPSETPALHSTLAPRSLAPALLQATATAATSPRARGGRGEASSSRGILPIPSQGILPLPPQALPFPCPSCTSRFATARGVRTHSGHCRRNRNVERAQREERERARFHDPSSQPSGSSPGPSAWSFIRQVDLEDIISRVGPPLMRRIPKSSLEIVRRAFMVALSAIIRDWQDVGGWILLTLFPRLVLGRVRGGHSGRRQLIARCRRFMEGDWEHLLQESERFGRSWEQRQHRRSSQHTGGAQSEGAESRRIARAIALARVGAYARACKALHFTPLAPATQETVEALRGLHPQSYGPLPDLDAAATSSPPLLLGAGTLAQALRTSPRLSCGGPSGLIYEHLRDLALGFGEAGGADGVFEALHSVLQHVAHGQVPGGVRGAIFSSVLLALQKGEGGGVRPVAIGEVLTRLIGKAICLQLGEDFARDLAPHQFGVAVAGGAEALVRGVMAAVELHPELVVFQADIRNAFNCISRESIFREIAVKRPELLRYLRLAYGERSPLFFRGSGGVEVIHSEEGARQGDPLGPVLFAYGFAHILRELAAQIPSAVVLAYADDLILLLPPSAEVIGHSWITLRRTAAEAHLEVVDPKSGMHSRRGLPEGLPLPSGVQRKEEGMVILGCPVGEATFQREYVRGRLQKFVEHIDILPQLHDLQSALPILTLCIVARPTYLARVLPPTQDMLQLYQTFDDRVRDTLVTLLGPSAVGGGASRSLTQASLPIARGGLGVRPLVRIAAAAYVGGWALVAPLIEQRFRRCDVHFLREAITGIEERRHPFQSALMDAWESLPESAREMCPRWPSLAVVTEPQLQARLTGAVESQVWEEMMNSFTVPEDRARVISAAGPGAGAWLSVRASTPQLQLADGLFRIAVLLRVGLPQPSLAGVRECGCGEELGERPERHILRCGHGPERTAAHDAMRDVMVDTLTDGGFGGRGEVVGLLTGERRVDVMGVDPRSGERLLGDVTIADPLRPAYVTRAAVTTGVAAAEEEREKRASYSGAILQDTDTFFPLALETYGCLGKSFEAFLKRCAHGALLRATGQIVAVDQTGLDASGPFAFQAARWMAFFRGRVAVTLQRAQAHAVIARSCRAIRGMRRDAAHRIGEVDLVTAVGYHPTAGVT